MPVPQIQSSAQVQTDFLSASDAARLVAHVGIVEVLRLVAEAVEADYGRWQDFDKSARTAAHCAVLMLREDARCSGKFPGRWAER